MLRISICRGCVEKYLLQRNCLQEPLARFDRASSLIFMLDWILLHSSPREMRPPSRQSSDARF